TLKMLLRAGFPQYGAGPVIAPVAQPVEHREAFIVASYGPRHRSQARAALLGVAGNTRPDRARYPWLPCSISPYGAHGGVSRPVVIVLLVRDPVHRQVKRTLKSVFRDRGERGNESPDRNYCTPRF